VKKAGQPDPVLLLAPEMVVRGGSLYVLDLAVGLRRKEVPLVVVSPGGPMVSRLLEHDIEHRTVPFRGGRLVDPVGLWHLRRTGREIGPRVVHILSESLDRIGPLLARILGVPAVLTAHGLRGPESYRVLGPRWSPKSMRAVRAVLAVSQAVREELVNVSRVPSLLVRPVLGGIDLGRYPDEPEPPLVPGRIPAVGTLTRLVRRRGLEDFLEASRLLVESEIEARFFVVGEGPLDRSLRRRLREAGLAHRVTIVPAPEPIERVFRAMDVFVLPSLREGLGSGLLEAMACARPVVATAVGGTFTVVTEGENGFLVPRGDTATLARRIRDLLEDPERAREMGARGRALVEERFTSERMVGEIQTVYDAVTAAG
jgi:glycosyltransferase involved in cell wall biosynthesis